MDHEECRYNGSSRSCRTLVGIYLIAINEKRYYSAAGSRVLNIINAWAQIHTPHKHTHTHTYTNAGTQTTRILAQRIKAREFIVRAIFFVGSRQSNWNYKFSLNKWSDYISFHIISFFFFVSFTGNNRMIYLDIIHLIDKRILYAFRILLIRDITNKYYKIELDNFFFLEYQFLK